MHKLVLIERDSASYRNWSSLMKFKRVPDLSVEKVIDKYQGFEGEFVCYFDVSEGVNNFEEMLNECLKYKKLGSCLLLHIISEPTTMPAFLKNHTAKLGYDVGICEKEKRIFSSIFHEILFANLDELAIYNDLLNENFLFSDRSLAKEYIKTHDEMSAQGKDVEDYEKMTIHEIWKHKC